MQSPEHGAHQDEAAKSRFIAVLGKHEKDRGQECEARSEVGGDTSFAQHKIENRADAVEEQAGGRVDVEEDRHQHGGAEHGKEMLQAQWHSLQKRQLCIDWDSTIAQIKHSSNKNTKHFTNNVA